jgi:hypothetical protein
LIDLAMSAFRFVAPLLAVSFLAFAGCQRHKAVAPNTEYYGVKVDWTKLDAAFTHSDPALRAGAALAKRHIVYRRFAQAMAQLDQLVTDPNLTESQKKVVGEVIEQTRQAMAHAPPPPSQ